MYLDKIYTNQPVTVTLTVGMVTIHTQDIVRIVLGGLYVYDHFDFLYRPDGETTKRRYQWIVSFQRQIVSQNVNCITKIDCIIIVSQFLIQIREIF